VYQVHTFYANVPGNRENVTVCNAETIMIMGIKMYDAECKMPDTTNRTLINKACYRFACREYKTA